MLTPSLMHHLSIVPDFRQAWKVQHQLSDILFLTVCAVICGAEGWDEIEDFGHAKLDFLSQYGDFTAGVPSHDTLARVMAMVNAEQLQNAFAEWMKACHDATEAHPMASRIQMIQGSSIAPDIIAQVHAVAANYSRILVMLDSSHTHAHVLAELEAYAPLTSVGSYCCVFDTVVEDMPKEMFPDRPWGPGDNPKTAVWEYLKTHGEFEIDKSIQHKLLITVPPDGYLKRVR